MAKQINEDRVREMVRTAILLEGSQKAFAQKLGVSEQYLSDVLKRRRSLSGARRLLDWLGLEAVATYRRKDGGSL